VRRFGRGEKNARQRLGCRPMKAVRSVSNAEWARHEYSIFSKGGDDMNVYRRIGAHPNHVPLWLFGVRDCAQAVGRHK
jgi:hypothetical protein